MLPLDGPPVYMRPPQDVDIKQFHVWELLKTMPGLKASPKLWGEHASRLLITRHRLTQSVADECVYYSAQVLLMRHIDDFAVVGETVAVKALMQDMKETLEITKTEFLENTDDRAQFLGAVMEKTPFGFSLKANPALIASIVDGEGLTTARVARTPGDKPKYEDDETPVDVALHSHFRTQTGKLLYLAQWRADLQHAVMRLTRVVSSPRPTDMAQLKRIIRYLAGTADRHLRIAPHHKWELLGEGDADWAGDPTERKSCSGGVVFLAGAVILTYARVQHARALSSCEP